jgi:hypothetical protein
MGVFAVARHCLAARKFEAAAGVEVMRGKK